MKIDIWSDYTCPFCYLGETKLKQALESYKQDEPVEINFRAFQLNPNAVRESDKDIHALIAEKYGISYEASKANNDRIIAAASEVGLKYDFENLKPNNTLKAHKLAKLAISLGKGLEATEQLFHEYFEKGMDIGSEAELIAVAKVLGISEEDLRAAWADTAIEAQIQADLDQASAYNITSVPFFVLNGKVGVSGAQSKEHFLMALKEAGK